MILGKEYRKCFMTLLAEDRSEQYVIENGFYIKRKMTLRYVYVQKLLKYTGLDSIKPLVAVFLVFLFFYGLNQFLLLVFQPLVTYYATGIENYTIASIWAHYPNVTTSAELYSLISQLTGKTDRIAYTFHYSIQAFIRFDLLCCFILFLALITKFRKKEWFRKQVYLRLFFFTLALIVLLIGTFFIDIHSKNRETEIMCYESYALLSQNSGTDTSVDNKDDIAKCFQLVKEEKKQLGQKLYYGAYGLRNRYAEFGDCCLDIYCESYRFFTTTVFVDMQ